MDDPKTQELIFLASLAVASNRVTLPMEVFMPTDTPPPPKTTTHTWIQTVGTIFIAALVAWGKISPYITGTTPTLTESNTTTALIDAIKTLSQAKSVNPIVADITKAESDAQAAVSAAIAKGETNRTVLAPLAASTFSTSLGIPSPVR